MNAYIHILQLNKLNHYGHCAQYAGSILYIFVVGTCSSSPRLLLSDYDYFAFEWLYISYYHDPFSYLHISYSVVTRREHAKGSLDQIQRRLPSRALCILCTSYDKRSIKDYH